MVEKLNLKFHRPKKDLCGICDSYEKASVSKKEPLQERYDQHKREKVEVRKRKEEAKVKAQENREFCAAVFDLQQVIYFPQSKRSELFYKKLQFHHV